MAALFVKGDAYAFNSRLFKLFVRFFHSLAVVADGVVFARDEKYRQIFGDGVNYLFGARLFNGRKQNIIAVIRKAESAQRVGFVSRYVCRVF